MSRIDGMNTLGTSRTQAGSATAASESSSRSNRGASGVDQLAGPQDKVSVSGRSRVVAEATAAVNNARDVRSEKVAALKASIANGTYSADPMQLASRMLSSLQA